VRLDFAIVTVLDHLRVAGGLPELGMVHGVDIRIALHEAVRESLAGNAVRRRLRHADDLAVVALTFLQ